MALSREEIRRISEQTCKEIAGGGAARDCLFDDIHDAIAAAKEAQRQLMLLSLEQRGRIIESIRQAARDNAVMLAELAHTETGYGKVAHKTLRPSSVQAQEPG